MNFPFGYVCTRHVKLEEGQLRASMRMHTQPSHKLGRHCLFGSVSSGSTPKIALHVKIQLYFGQHTVAQRHVMRPLSGSQPE